MIDVFRVGVHIGMTTNATQVLAHMLRELTGLHVAVERLERHLGAVRTAAIGAGAAFAGWAVLKGISSAVIEGRALNKELEKTKQLGGEFAAHIAQTRANALAATNAAPTTLWSDNVRLAREMGVTIGNPAAAEAMLPEAAKTAYVVSHFTGEKEEDIIKNLMRVADLRAQIYSMGADGKEHVDPMKLHAEMEAAGRGLILGGGFIKSNDLLQATKMAGPAAKLQSPEAFYAAGVEAGIAMGASRLGTAETGLMQQFIGGTMTKKVAVNMEEAGLLKPGEWTSGRSGGVVVGSSATKRFEAMLKDPIAWLEGPGEAAIKAYAAKEHLDVTSAVFRLFGRQTVQRLVNEAMSNEPQFARARQIYGNIPSVQEQYKELHAHDLDTNLRELQSAWKSFMEALSDAGTPAAIKILHGLTDAINFFKNAAGAHPEVTKYLMEIAAGIGAIAMVGGIATLGSVVLPAIANGLGMLTGLNLTGAAMGLAAIARGLSGVIAVLSVAGFLKGKLDEGSDWVYDKIFGPGAAQKMHEDIEKGNPFTRKEGYGPQWDLNRRLRRGHPGYDQNGDPLPSVAPPASGGEKHSWNLYVDGKKLAMIVGDHMADSLAKPSSGRNGYDLRVTPAMPGMLTAVG